MGRNDPGPCLQGTGSKSQGCSQSTGRIEVLRSDSGGMDDNVSTRTMVKLDCPLTVAGRAGAEDSAISGSPSM